jgi:ABC-type nitrate/sulfonate/bicarbonate transport system substrate-binding protein
MREKQRRALFNLNPSRRSTFIMASAAALSTIADAFPSFYVRKASAQRSTDKISLLMGTTPHFGNVIIADVKGIFRKHGLLVEITNFSSGAVATQAFAANQGDLVNAADLSALLLWNRGHVGLCPQAKFQDLTVIVGRKNINNPSDLKGKKVGVLMASTSEYFTRVYLSSGGVQFTEIDAINLPPAQMVTGFVSGDLDAFVIWQPFGWRALEAAADSHVVATAGKYIREYQFLTMRRGYYDSHATELTAFLSALSEASKWLSANLDEGATLVSSRIGLGDPTIARRMFDHIRFDMTFTAQLQTDMEAAANFLGIKIDWPTMFETRPLKSVNPDFVQTG